MARFADFGVSLLARDVQSLKRDNVRLVAFDDAMRFGLGRERIDAPFRKLGIQLYDIDRTPLAPMLVLGMARLDLTIDHAAVRQADDSTLRRMIADKSIEALEAIERATGWKDE